MISLPTLVAVVALRNSINKKCANDKNLANDINNTIKTNTRNIRNKKKQWQRSQVCELCQYSKPHPCHRQYQDDMAVHGLGLPHISGIMAQSWRHLRTILNSQRHFSMASPWHRLVSPWRQLRYLKQPRFPSANYCIFTFWLNFTWSCPGENFAGAILSLAAIPRRIHRISFDLRS